MNPRHLFLFLVLFVPLLANVPVCAVTMMELIEADKVRIKAWIEPEENIVARQQIRIHIETATDRWFSGGTRIRSVQVKDAIVLQREKFAINSSRREGGRNWTVQQWTLLVYPQRHGEFEIPSVPVHLSIAGENLEAIVGELNTPPLSFVARLPGSISNSNLETTDWIATTRFAVTASFDRSFDELRPGDAITRVIRISADDLPAMMLPTVAEEGMPGMAVYPKPPRLTDKTNRGIYSAERTQVTTYVFESPGQYRLPGQTFYWWNLETQSLETVDLEEQTLEVRSSSEVMDAGIPQQTSANQYDPRELVPLLIQAGLISSILLVIVVVIRRVAAPLMQRTRAEPKEISEAALLRQFKLACGKNDLEHAMGLFYRWADRFGGQAFKGTVRETLDEFDQVQLSSAFKEVSRSIYAADKPLETDLRLFARQFIRLLKESSGQRRFDGLRVDLKLN
jgi:hypothetical protein